MDLSAISSLSGLSYSSGLNSIDDISNISTLTGSLTKVNTDKKSVDGTMFDSILNSAISNIKTTNSYLSDAENEEIKFALGETENTHDLTIALQKASTALQYTVAVRDKVLEAYRELMQMQI